MQTLLIDALIGLITLFVLMLVIAAAWGLFLRVPSVPTPMRVVRAMVDLAELRGGETVVDLGAGDSRLLIEAKKKYPSIRAVGCELNPPVWLLGKIRAWASRARIELHLRSVLTEDLTRADVVFLYLFPEVMQRLTEKFDRELRPGTRIVSYMFRLKNREPMGMKKVMGYWGDATVYVYHW